MHTVAVSYLEWIRWVATGWFRCADRVVWLRGSDDQEGMDALLDRTPDLQVSDDQGYVIACLRSDIRLESLQSIGGRSIGHFWLSVDRVASFHPLSVRGARLLEADAERAAAHLSEPIFEKLWADWRDRRLEGEAHQRGLSLCSAFGLQSPNLTQVSTLIRKILAGLAPAPFFEKARDKDWGGTRAFGWAAAMSIVVIDVSAKDVVDKNPQSGEMRVALRDMKGNFDLRRPLLDDTLMTRLAGEIDVILRERFGDSMPIGAMATVLHYRDLAAGGRPFSLEALLADLADIALVDPHNAALCAYFIGRSMENVAVTTLLYQAIPTSYAALKPGTPAAHLDVMKRAAAKFEAQQLALAPVARETATLAGVDKDSRQHEETTSVEGIGHPNEPFVKETNISQEISADSEPSAVVLGPDQHVQLVSVTPDGLMESEPGNQSAAEGLATPGDTKNDSEIPATGSLNLPQTFGTEVKTDLFPGVLGDAAPYSSQPSKIRKGRKKADKPIEPKPP